jgi:hypothetical protein
MAQLSYLPQNPEKQGLEQTHRGLNWKKWTKDWRIQLVALLFIVELFVSFILWKAGLPRTTDVIKEAIALGMILVTMATMLVRDRIPRIMLLILSITLIWGAVALFDGQSFSATLWGWFRFFKYLFVGLFVYLIMRWPPDFAQKLLRFCVWLLAFEVVVQLIQYANGQLPGDSLAGTFGWKGVSDLSMLVFFVVCLGFGHWLATKQWKILLATIVLGLIASMLDLTKFYIPAVIIVGVAALVVHMVRGGQFRQLFVYVVLFSLLMAAFVPLYNNYIATTQGLKPLQEYLTPAALDAYLFNDGEGDEDGSYNLGRGLSLAYGWQTLQRDSTTLLFGFGLGSRTYSSALGVTGNSFDQDLYGGAGGTGLLIMMQEYGLVGLGLFAAFNLWVMLSLFQNARRNDDPHLAALQYGLILFTLFWPMWIWYTKPWVAGVMMILYWGTLGYVFRQMMLRRRESDHVIIQREPESYPVIPVIASANGTSPGTSIVASSNHHH